MPAKSKMNDEKLSKMKELAKLNYNKSEIAVLINESIANVKYWFKKFDIKLSNNTRNNKKTFEKQLKFINICQQAVDSGTKYH